MAQSGAPVVGHRGTNGPPAGLPSTGTGAAAPEADPVGWCRVPFPWVRMTG